MRKEFRRMRTVRLWLLRKLEKLNEWLDHRDDMRDIARYKKWRKQRYGRE